MNLNIDLQQVYLLQSEAHENKTLMFICEYFRLHGRVKHWLIIWTEQIKEPAPIYDTVSVDVEKY